MYHQSPAKNSSKCWPRTYTQFESTLRPAPLDLDRPAAGTGSSSSAHHLDGLLTRRVEQAYLPVTPNRRIFRLSRAESWFLHRNNQCA